MSIPDGQQQGAEIALPWLDALFSRLVEARVAQTLAHALLLRGPAGVGKDALSAVLARAWLCEASSTAARPCGACRSCGLTAVGNHPDYHRLAPAEGKSTISVDQVRELSAELALKSHAGGSRVALIAPAEAMTISAQNSLLKTLEEPPEGAILLLVTHRVDALAATVRSRCQQVFVPLPSAQQASAWLAVQERDGAQAEEALRLARGAPLVALGLLEDGFSEQASALAQTLGQIAVGREEPISVASRWEKLDLDRIIAWWQGALHALAYETLGAPAAGAPGAGVIAQSHQALAQQGGRWIAPDHLFAFGDRLAEASLTLRGQANPRLVLEGLLIDWARITRPARARRRPA